MTNFAYTEKLTQDIQHLRTERDKLLGNLESGTLSATDYDLVTGHLLDTVRKISYFNNELLEIQVHDALQERQWLLKQHEDAENLCTLLKESVSNTYPDSQLIELKQKQLADANQLRHRYREAIHYLEEKHHMTPVFL